jgi:hypothetical protein
MKHPVLVKKDYTIYFEYVLYNEIQEIIVVHCDITKWNKTVKHQLAVDSYNLFSKQDKPIVAVHDKEDKKHFKFITMMGFYPCLDEILIEDGSKNMMFIWSNI